MTALAMIYCLVLAGPIAVSATENVADGEFIELPQGDFDQLSRWGIVRRATEAEEEANRSIEVASQVVEGLSTEEGKSADPLGSAETEPPKETATQKKKREAAEAKATKELADQEAAEAKELADKEAAEKLANQTNELAE